jgi:Flp pilus assembly protein TadG
MLPRLVLRFRVNRSGASALEFAILAGPVIFLLLAVLEVSLVFIATFSLENATAQGARLIRTGQAQTQGFNASSFQTELCKNMVGPLDCARVKLDVRNFSSFGGVSGNLPSPLDGNGNVKNSFSYAPGKGGDVVVVRAFYEWEVTGRMPKGVGLSNLGNGNRLLQATATFRNEPFKTAPQGAGAGS